MLEKLHGSDAGCRCYCYQVGGLHRNGHRATAGSFGELSDQLSCEWRSVPGAAATPIPAMNPSNHVRAGMTEEERQELESMRQHEQQLCEQLDK